MPEYRLFHFSGGRIVRADVIVAEDDTLAIEEAIQKAGGKPAELWRGAAKVRVLNRSTGP